MNKRGQATILIIFAIAVALIILITFFISNNSLNPFSATSFDKQVESINNQVETCFNNLGINAINKVAFQGGYFLEPLTEYLQYDLNSIPFYYFGEIEYIPETNLIEEQISYYIDSNKDSCLRILSDSELEYNYVYDLPNITITENSVEIKNNLKISLSKDNITTNIELSDPIEINSNIKEMNSLASYITYSYQLNDESLCLSCFQEIAQDEGLIVNIDNSLGPILIVSINETNKEYPPRQYNFALSATKEQQEDASIENYDFPTYSPDNNLNFNTKSFDGQ